MNGNSQRWVWPADSDGQAIQEIPVELMDIEIHPYFKGRLPIQVARRLQASFTEAERRFQHDLGIERAKVGEVEGRIDSLKLVIKDLERRNAALSACEAEIARSTRRAQEWEANYQALGQSLRRTEQAWTASEAEVAKLTRWTQEWQGKHQALEKDLRRVEQSRDRHFERVKKLEKANRGLRAELAAVKALAMARERRQVNAPAWKAICG